MAKRKERTLRDLYNVTQTVSRPEINPILNGSCRMQGPIDDIDCDVQTNTVSTHIGEGFSRCFKSPNVSGRVEAGTCNVCFAPCSSCLHIMRTLMGSKTDESSDENCGENESKVSLRTSGVLGELADVVMLSKLSSEATDKEDNHTLKPESDSDDISFTTKIKDRKGFLGLDNNISCVSEANEASDLFSCDVKNFDKINVSCFASESCSLHTGHKELAETQLSHECLGVKCDIRGCQNHSMKPSCSNKEYGKLLNLPNSSSTEVSVDNSGLNLKGIDSSAASAKVQNTCSHSPSGSVVTSDQNCKKMEDNSCDRMQGELLECSREHTSLIPMKNIKRGNFVSDNQHCESNTVVGGFDALVCPKLEVNTEGEAVEAKYPTQTLEDVGGEKEVEAAKELLVPSDVKKASLQSLFADESESEVLEHDVKVCDICGDAGREDLLAVCCRCSDGAEHTYCMKELLDRVPEGDWLCEECKCDEDMNNQMQDTFAIVHEKSKNQSSGELGTKSMIRLSKSEAKNSEDNSGVRVSGKRHAEDAEVSSSAKKQALELTIGSPRTSGAGMVASLSRDSSFKNLHRGKVKPNSQPSPGAQCTNDIPETGSFQSAGSLLQTPRGAFARSDSFNSNAKRKVKLVDAVVPQKQKTSREYSALEAKEGVTRLGKTMSFRSASSGPTGESKVKMSSPRLSHIQEPKGLKQSKERNYIERRNSFNFSRSERPLATLACTSSTSKGDKKLTSRSETYSLSPISCESKGIQSDSKPITCSKPSHIARRGTEMPVSSGETKRQSSCSLNVVGSSSAIGSSSEELRLNKYGQKEDSSSSSSIAEKSSCNGNDNHPEGMSCPLESILLGERSKESSVSHQRQGLVMSARSVQCQKCKQSGHPSQLCTAESSRSLALDASTAKSLREGTNYGDKLKAAIEAAMLKKPGIYKKKVSDQNDELPALSCNDKIVSEEKFPSSGRSSMFSAEAPHEVQRMSHISANECCSETSLTYMRQSSMLPVDVASSIADVVVGSSDDKFSGTEWPCHALAEMSDLLKTSVIPELECIWQGSFDVHRSGKIPELFDGIQAHLSTCASPKVLEASNKFPHKILLQEVPRLSAWPIQFQENNVKEDNIALYFFAKDLQSYEKGYMILLEGMMKNDLALKGHLDGVELLIFPSKQLPEQSQRWNMLYFLWGVFRAKRVHDLTKELPPPLYTPSAIMSLPENICLRGSLDRDLQVTDKASNVVRVSAATTCQTLPSSPLSSKTKGSNENLVCSATCIDLSVKLEPADNKLDSHSLAINQVQEIDKQSCPELRYNTFLEKEAASDCKANAVLLASAQAAQISGLPGRCEQMLWETRTDRNQSPSHSIDKYSAGTRELVSAGSTIEQTPDKMNRMNDEVKSDRSFVEKSSSDVVAVSVRAVETRTSSVKYAEGLHSNHMKRTHGKVISDCYASPKEAMRWNFADASKRQKASFSGFYECDDVSSSSGNVSTSSRHGKCAGSEAKMKNSEGCGKTPENLGSAEMYFFPVNPGPPEVIDLTGSSGPLKALTPASREWLKDGALNLDLALGAESKTAKQDIPRFLIGRVDKKNNPDRISDKRAGKEDEDEASATLSLSLSFPSQSKEVAANPVSRTEQLRSQRQHANSSLLFYGGLSDG